MHAVSTFSICAVDPRTRILGAAVASRYLAVGALVPHLAVDAGVILTQSIANPRFGPAGLGFLADGMAPALVIERLLENDAERAIRQIGVLRFDGNSATFSGPDCIPVVADATVPGVVATGNTLASEAVPAAMVAAYQVSRDADAANTAAASKDAAIRMATALIAALRAGEAAGGDKRGKQAAAVIVKGPGAGYGGNGDTAVDLRVDDHRDPVSELARIFALFTELR